MRAERVAAGPGRSDRFGRAVLTHATVAGVSAVLLDARARPWVSATFVGERYRLVLALPDHEAAATWLASLPEAEMTVPNRIVADLTVRRDGAEAVVEALLLDAA